MGGSRSSRTSSLDLSDACKLRETVREGPLRGDPKLVPRRPLLARCRLSFKHIGLKSPRAAIGGTRPTTDVQSCQHRTFNVREHRPLLFAAHTQSPMHCMEDF